MRQGIEMTVCTSVPALLAVIPELSHLPVFPDTVAYLPRKGAGVRSPSTDQPLGAGAGERGCVDTPLEPSWEPPGMGTARAAPSTSPLPWGATLTPERPRGTILHLLVVRWSSSLRLLEHDCVRSEHPSRLAAARQFAGQRAGAAGLQRVFYCTFRPDAKIQSNGF